ncbi:MAG: maleate cis-trans isomerase family protein [Candidatus Puniceispirillaceae bacterium]
MDSADSSTADGFTLIEHLPFTTAGVIGSRARIGLVVLASDYTIEHEFRAMVAMPGVDIFMARIMNDPKVTPDTLAAMEPLLTETASRILPGDRVDVLAYGCTSASVVLGAERVADRLAEAKPGTPTSNPISAAFAAFDALGARRIGVLTPYRRDVNEQIHRYITGHGYEVPVFGSFNEEMDPVVATIDETSLVRAIDTIREGHDIDAVFVSCTSVRLADAVAGIEARISLPVTSSNHAMAWHCLRLAGVDEAIEGRGRLFTLGLGQ